jgi:hypothetical protein
VRSDLYELNPGTGPATFLGYFQLSGSGAMTFTAVPEPSVFGLVVAGFSILLVMNRPQRTVSIKKTL